jgi:predicted dinucleotide-binding enzyme
MASLQSIDDHPYLRLLEPGEELHSVAEATDASLIVTNRRVAVARNDHLALAIPFEALRRVQFDIDRNRLATLVLVPDSPAHPPQVLEILPDQYGDAAQALAAIADRLAKV